MCRGVPRMCCHAELMLHIQKFLTPMMCADYIDYQNRRPDYIGEFVENLINWNKVPYHVSQLHT